MTVEGNRGTIEWLPSSPPLAQGQGRGQLNPSHGLSLTVTLRAKTILLGSGGRESENLARVLLLHLLSFL